MIDENGQACDDCPYCDGEGVDATGDECAWCDGTGCNDGQADVPGHHEESE